jgi:prepilin-type processing-associated H-X9-DG protein
MPTSSSVDWSEIINREYFGLKRQISFAGKGTYIPRVGQPGKGALACPNYDWQAVSNSRPYKINVNVTGGVAPSGSPPPYAQLVTDPRQIEPFYASYYLGTQLSRFRNPGYKFLVNEGDRYSDGANSSLPAPGFLTFGDDPLIPLPWAANGGSFSFRHDNYTRMNVVFLDGHVESLTVKDEVNSRRRFQLTD